jgi:hypothetical protein
MGTDMKKFSPHAVTVNTHNGQMGGYFFVTVPEHPYATKRTGRVVLHRLLMENMVGRYLEPDEIVHHKDGNKHNNNPENLELVSKAEHARRHRDPAPRRKCIGCGHIFIVTVYITGSHRYSGTRYCSQECRENKRSSTIAKSCRNQIISKSTRPAKPTCAELKSLVWLMSTEKVGDKFGVTGKAVEKWCKIYNISKPPRGYWAKQYASK